MRGWILLAVLAVGCDNSECHDGLEASADSSSPSNFVVTDDLLLFTGYVGGGNDFRFFAMDAAGSLTTFDGAYDVIGPVLAHDNAMYFAQTEDFVQVLYRFDGRHAPERVTEVDNSFARIEPRFVSGGRMYIYSFPQSSDDEDEWWIYDGVNPPSWLMSAETHDLCAIGDTLYDAHDGELWRTEAGGDSERIFSEEGFALPQDLWLAAVGHRCVAWRDAHYLIAADGRLLRVSGNDVTVETTLPYYDTPLTVGLWPIGNVLYYACQFDSVCRYEVGSEPVVDSDIAGTLDGLAMDQESGDVGVFKGKAYFAEYDNNAGRELWVHDGVWQRRYRDLDPGFVCEDPDEE